MIVVFISNAMTPHQKPLCDALLKEDSIEFFFIELKEVNRESLPIGWRSNLLPNYVITYSAFNQKIDIYEQLIYNADVVIFGGIKYIPFLFRRLRAGKLTFIYSERIYKSIRNILRFPYHYVRYRRLLNYPNLYLLCASAYSKGDYGKLGCFNGRAFKWGYFTNVPNIDITENNRWYRNFHRMRILWVGRFIDWKHPEVPVMIASMLKKRGYDIEINMFGIGPELDKTKELATELGVDDVVKFHGSVDNEEIHRQMRQHHMFLFTSDRNEGWGAVANEAMSNGCALIGSDAIGSIPYLVKDGWNGLIYRDGDINDLYSKVKQVIDEPALRETLAKNAYETMRDIWSPRNAAENLIKLIKNLQEGKDTSILEGPCSKA